MKQQEEEKNDEEVSIENIKQYITSNQKEIQLPNIRALNEQEGRPMSQHSSSVVRMGQAKRVKFQGDLSQDGSTTRIPKRGSSRGTSIASSNKNEKDDNILEELDGLFAQEYKKPQRSIVDSLNTSKKNTPDNSSSKPNKNEADDLNDQILMKKLEDL